MKPQTASVLALLRDFGSGGITSLEALDAVGTSRMAARVQELRAEGFDIRTRWERTRNGKRIARYTIHEAPVQLAAFA